MSETLTETKAARTRERILAAAAAELRAHGYAGAKLTAIARRAGIQPPAMYYHFASREELVAEVMTSGQHRLREHVGSVLAALPDAPPMERIVAAVRAHLEIALELSDFASAVARNVEQLPPALREEQRTEGRAYITIWRNLLDEARAAGQVRDNIELGAATMLVIGALNSSVDWWHASRGSLEDVIHTAQTIVRNGLSP